MGKCIIICPLYEGEEKAFLSRDTGDILLCADGGLEKAERYGMKPDLVIGDFDSMPPPENPSFQVMRLEVKKDDTDTAVCVREGRKRGFREFRIGGGLGGRFDHTLANLQILADCASRGEQGWIVDARNRVTVLGPGEYTVPRIADRKISLFAYTESVRGVTLKGTEWELENAELVQTFPLGCSNWFRADRAVLRFREGLMIVALCGD